MSKPGKRALAVVMTKDELNLKNLRKTAVPLIDSLYIKAKFLAAY